jgi:hypothetical protein
MRRTRIGLAILMVLAALVAVPGSALAEERT